MRASGSIRARVQRRRVNREILMPPWDAKEKARASGFFEMA
jgi:hypothetical protein